MKDLVAAWCSGLCIVHCLLTPALLLAGIAGAAPWLEQDWLHLSLLVPVVLLLIWSLPASRKCHGRNSPLLLAIPGLFLLVVGWFMPEELEVWCSVAGALLLMLGHLLNRQYLKQQQLLSHC